MRRAAFTRRRTVPAVWRSSRLTAALSYLVREMKSGIAPCGTVPISSPVAGLVASNVSPLALGCQLPHHLPRATEHIAEMISLIEKLLARGIAYRAADGSIYFSIQKYQACGCRYGQLINLDFEQMRPGQRVQSDEYSKESVADFALSPPRAVARMRAAIAPAP